MKKIFALFAITLAFWSCSDDNDPIAMKVNGKLVNQVTATPIPNATIFYRVFQVVGTGTFSYDEEISTGSVVTDSDGKFTANIKYVNKANVIIQFDKVDDAFSTAILDQKKGFSLKELKQNPNVTFTAREWETLRVKIKNTNPFDSHDAVSIYISINNTNYINTPIYNIINYGVANQNEFEPYWVGTNIDSEVFFRIQNGTSYYVFWYPVKNGVSTTNYSAETTTLSGQENFYQVNF